MNHVRQYEVRFRNTLPKEDRFTRDCGWGMHDGADTKLKDVFADRIIHWGLLRQVLR
jgi:hypothetical protein